MDNPENSSKIVFEPSGRRVVLSNGETLLSGAQRVDAGLIATCGGEGICGDCKVRLISGKYSDPSRQEKQLLSQAELESGIRLACQTRPEGSGVVDIPPESLSARQRLQLENQTSPLILDLPTRFHNLRPHEEKSLSLEGWKTILVEFCTENRLELTPACLEQSLKTITACSGLAQLIYQDEVFLGCLPANVIPLGLAVDMGSTKLAAYLLSLVDGKVLAAKAAMNPQIAYGEDVIARIGYANAAPVNETRLHSLLVDSINRLCHEMCTDIGAEPIQVVDAVLVGNTVMHHFCANLPVRSLGEAPFQPVQSAALNLPAGQIGLQIHPGARVYLPPNIAGYLGGDHVAMLLANGCYPPASRVMAMDIGTNTEISLSVDGNLFSCSCASGPAFEGARIKEGMRAAPGAIEKVRLVDGRIHLHTIDNQLAAGICGSGILDAVAVMLADQAIDARGAFQKQHPRIKDDAGLKTYPLVDAAHPDWKRAVHIYRKDVNEIQLAKAAIRTGCDVLMRSAGITPTDIDQMILAGAFGNYLSIESAIQIGMFPPIPPARIQQVGNAAGKGAQMLLCSKSARQKADEIAHTSSPIELARQTDFMQLFTNNLSFD